MPRRSDQVFQLSLTEIAFTVSFILLLLLGYLVFREQSKRVEAERALGEVTTAQRATAALTTAKQELQEALARGGVPNPSEVVSRLVAAEGARAEREQLRKQIEELDSKLSALVEIQRLLDSVASPDRTRAAQESALGALQWEAQVRKSLWESKLISDPKAKPANREGLQQTRQQEVRAVKAAISVAGELKQNLGVDVVSAEAVRDIVRDAKSFRDLHAPGVDSESLKRDNANLRGQLAFFKRRLEARGGRDFPPCWTDESGKIEYLFRIELRSDAISIARDWPARRDADVATLPGVSAALAKDHSHTEFSAMVKPIFDWSRSRDPECRHYVQLRSKISDAVQSDRARLMVESVFYKVEAPR